MVREVEVSINERDFVLSALKLNTRVDGRGPFDIRDLKIKIDDEGSRYGQVELCLGKTRVLASVSAELTHPFPDRPTEGILQFSTHFPSTLHGSFEVGRGGRPSDLEIVISRLLERIFRKGRVIEMEGLCVVAGQKVWTVRMDLHVLSVDGNVMDACAWAALTAFMHFRRPEVSVYNSEEVVIHSFADKHPVPLSIRYYPVSMTFALYQHQMSGVRDDSINNEEEEFILLDPSRLEERLQNGELVLVMTQHGQLVTINLPGGLTIHPDTILRCGTIAQERIKTIFQFIESHVKASITRLSKLSK